MGDVVIGTCSWTDPSMVERWYPRGVRTAEARLRYYAERFDTVEVDSSFYAIPSARAAVAWVKRTPAWFTFHVKAYGLMTGHEVDARSLHPELRDSGYRYDVSSRGRVRQPEERMVERAFELFIDALEPLSAAGKLGGVLMQYPPWFVATDREQRVRALARIERDLALLEPLTACVEFRHASWARPRSLSEVTRVLARQGAALVAVDAPQVGDTAMPPVAIATGRFGYVRFHGRNRATWRARTASAADRFDYLYTREELAEWEDRIRGLARGTERTWVMFNNCKYDYAPRNAREMALVLGDLVARRPNGAATGEPPGHPSAAAEEGAEQLDLGI